MAETLGKKNNATNHGFPSKPARHYTEYNLFFQLEREYILQKIFDVKPQIKHADDIFDTTKSSYSGPPLPERYDDLILKKDWYIPGNKKKRKHKKSHGKISFIDLSRQVAREWARAGDDVKDFCAKLCHIGARKIKREGTVESKRLQTHEINDECEMKDYDKKENPDLYNESQKGPPFDDECPMEANQDGFNKSNLQSTTSVLFAHYFSALVKEDSRFYVRMDDNEIRRLWISQNQCIDNFVNYRDNQNDDGELWYCRPCSTEDVSLSTSHYSAACIGLCSEVPPQVPTSFGPHLPRKHL